MPRFDLPKVIIKFKFKNFLLTVTALFSYGGIVAGGSPTSDAEIIDISGKQLFCSKPPNHRKNLKGMSGTFYHGEAIVCGGYLEEAKIFSDECYKYNGERR